MSYYDNILIKLRRKYSKDETVSALSKKLQEVEIELGKAISYIHELKHGIELKNREIKDLNKKIATKNQEHKVRYLKDEIKKTNSENQRLRLINKELREKLNKNGY